jgi:imidazoleglycerol phosphate dehydratase HisB
MSERSATVERETSETSIKCSIVLDNEPGVRKQEINVSTGIGFLDHVSVPPRLCCERQSFVRNLPTADK